MTVKFDRRPAFTITKEDEFLLSEAAHELRCSKSYLIRELIRGNVSMQKSPEAA